MIESRKKNKGLELAEQEGAEAALTRKPRSCPYGAYRDGDDSIFRDVRSLKRRIRVWYQAYDKAKSEKVGISQTPEKDGKNPVLSV